MTGIIYILTNEAMPGYIKIGKTRTRLLQRLRSLDNTSTPLPFDCFFAAEVEDCDTAERLLHDAFSDRRTRNNREFFEISPERVASALKLAALREVTPETEIAETAEDKAAVKRASERRTPFNFKLVDIQVGETLTFVKDASITCTVVDQKKVLLDGITMSLSSAALTCFHRLGYTWKAVSGPESWEYNGVTLDELRKDAENPD